MSQTLQNIVSKIIHAGIVLTVFVPFVRGYFIFFPQGFGKAIVFKIIIEILIALYLILIIFNKDYLPWRVYPVRNKPQRDVGTNAALSVGWISNGATKFGLIEWSALGFLIIMMIAALFSVDRHLSFWGEPERAGGLFAFFHYILLFFLALIFLNEKKWRGVWFAAIFASVLIAAITVEQKFNFLNLYFLNYYERPSSVIGNPNFLAAYLLLFAFPTFSFALQKFNVWRFLPKRNGFQAFGAAGYLFAAALQVFAVLVTASRGAFVGLAAGAVLFLFLYPAKKHYFKLAAGAFVALFIISLYLPRMFPDNPLASKDGVFQRLSTISLSEHTTQTRLLAWQISWNAFKEKPILGWGPENFSIGFDKHFNPEISKWGVTETWFDRAHNFIFDIGVTSGIAGLVSYLAIFAAVFYKLSLKKRQLLSDPQSAIYNLRSKIIIITALQGAWTAYLVQNLFNFDTVSTYVVFFLMLAYTIYVVQNTNNEVVIARPRMRPWQSLRDSSLTLRMTKLFGSLSSKSYTSIAIKIIGAVLIIFFISKLIFFANLRPLWTNYEVNRLVDLIKTGYPEQALAQFDELSRAKTPYDHYFYLLNQSPWAFYYAQTIKDTNPEKSKKIMEETVERVKKYGRLRPYYTRNYLFLADLYDFLIKQGYSEFKKDKDEAMRKAKELSPNRLAK